jgi:hypothetical protein
MIGAALQAVSGLASTVAGAVGAAKERKMRKKAAELAQKGVGELQGGKGYSADKALEFLGLTNQSAYDSMDPESKGYSMDALKNLVARGSGSGLDVQSKQALSEAIGRSGAAQNAARQAVMQEYQQRGQSGGGQELLGMLTGQQQNYGNLAGATGQAAAAAEQRRLEANVLASRAGQQQQQLEQQKASALDALQRFNVGARQNTLGLEKDYRQGAAGAYQGAANTLAGLAPGAARPAQNMGNAIGAGMNYAAQGYGALQNLFGGEQQPLPGMNYGGGGGGAFESTGGVPTYGGASDPGGAQDYKWKADVGQGGAW